VVNQANTQKGNTKERLSSRWSVPFKMVCLLINPRKRNNIKNYFIMPKTYILCSSMTETIKVILKRH